MLRDAGLVPKLESMGKTPFTGCGNWSSVVSVNCGLVHAASALLISLNEYSISRYVLSFPLKSVMVHHVYSQNNTLLSR